MSPVAEAIEHLSSFVLPYSGKAAVSYLQALLKQSLFDCIYQYFFPSEYAALIKQRKAASDSLTDKQKMLSLLRLIDQHLLPLFIDLEDDGEWEDEEHREYVENYIPIQVFGWCEWINDGDIEYHCFEIQVLMFLADENLQDPDPYFGGESARQFVQSRASCMGLGAIAREKLETLCDQEESPLRYLPTALLQATGELDNVFLCCFDSELITVQDREWSISNLRDWHETWQAAEVTLAQINDVVTYLREDIEHVNRVLELWNLSIKP
jgi:hypothetical protein